MEQLIRALTDPSNQGSSERIEEIQRQLQLLQRQPTAWQGALELLSHAEPNMRFYGALTLTIKINADWQNDALSKDSRRRSSLLQALVESFVRLTLMEDEAFVLQKLASTLALLYQKVGSEWQHPVRHILASVIHGGYLPVSNLPTMKSLVARLSQRPEKQIASVFVLVKTLPEDVSAKLQGSSIQKELSLSSGDALELIECVLVGHCRKYLNSETPTSVPPTELPKRESEHLSLLALDVLPLWTSLLKLQEYVASSDEATAANASAISSLQACLQMLNSGALNEHPLQALVAIQALTPRLVMKAQPDFEPGFATFPFVQKWATGLVQGDFSSESMLLVELMEAILLHVDVTTPTYIRSGDYNGMLELVLLLLRCEGAAAVEDQACVTMLEICNSILEGFNDWDHDAAAEQYLSQFAKQACEACLHKVKYPSEELTVSTRSWDKDDLAAFREFRLDVGDFLQAAFTLLGKPLIEAISESVLRGPPGSSWADFEASLECLLAFSETINSSVETYSGLVTSVLGAHYFQQMLQSADVPDAARKTCITFLASMTSYLKSHPSLPQALNFLFSSLQQPSSATAASRAIHSLCDSQRASLIEALPGFMASLDTIDHLRGMNRNRIYGAVAAIIQALPSDEQKLQPLHEILNLLQRDFDQSQSVHVEDDLLLQLDTELLQTLAAIGRGLRDPADGGPASEAPDLTPTVLFWVRGQGLQIQQQVLTIYRSIMQRIGQRASYDVVEAACDFISSGFPETHPSPFKFDNSTSTELIISNITLDTPNLDAVMSIASGLLAASTRADFQPYLQTLLHPTLAGMQQLLTCEGRIAKIRDSSYPAATLDFMSRLLPRTHAHTLLELTEAQQALHVCLELALIVLNEPDTLPRRSGAQFIGVFTELSKPGKVAEGVAKQNVEAVAQEYNPRIIASILRLVAGDCARSETDILSDQIRRYVIAQPMAFKNIGKEAIKEESAVLSEKALHATTLDQRTRFLAQVDTMRGSRKTNDVVRNFWVTCRGSEYSYIV
jgi:hypothetical protein